MTASATSATPAATEKGETALRALLSVRIDIVPGFGSGGERVISW